MRGVAADEVRLVLRAVEHRPRVVGHPAVDADPRGGVRLDRLDGVERHARVGHERAPRLVGDPHVRAEDVVDERDLLGDVVLDRGRVLVVRVGDAEAAAEVPGPELPQARHRLERRPERREVEDLRADVHVQAVELQDVRAAQPGDRLRRGGEVHAELRVGPAGGDARVRVRRDAGGDAQEDPLGPAGRAHERLEPLDLVEVVDDDVADPRLDGLAQLAVGLRVAVQVDARRVEAGGQGHRQLAAAGDVAGQALLGEDPQDRRAGEGLGGEVDLDVVAVALGERGEEPAGARAQHRLVDDVERRAERAGQLEGVAAAELEHAAAVQPSGVGPDVGQLGLDRRHGAR
jgi:hypothetical protein